MTTSLTVAAVGSGALPLPIAVFTILGCNVGTTITNTLVAMTHMRQDAEFKRAFAGATMHDFFNLMALMVFIPLELATGILRSSAEALSQYFYGSDAGASAGFESPIKTAVKPVVNLLEGFFHDDLGFSSQTTGIILLVVALGFVAFSLIWITRTMRVLIASRLEQSLNRVLNERGLLAILIGLLVTVSVQSSSITTSLMIPLFGAGILKLENGFPVTLGANIGTTITALLAALSSNQAGLTIAFVHLIFNVSATLLIYPIPSIRNIPIRLAKGLAERSAKNKLFGIGYVVGVFVFLPLLGYMFF
jgi:sodium-dependent phosphate cotransporter